MWAAKKSRSNLLGVGKGKSRAVVIVDKEGLLGEGGFELTFCVVFHLE